jgi:NAD(P)-dependent dehydrogenase (short-subunit alcohol dehydrogenase family)
MDVDNEDSVQKAVDTVMDKESRLDIVVNSAGFGLAGALEDTWIEEAKQQFETNFFGVLRICRAVLPVMRRQRYGYLVNVSSIGGCSAFHFKAFIVPASLRWKVCVKHSVWRSNRMAYASC